jgi:hypothetical protein
MNDKTPAQDKAKAAREARLSEQLRANLRRRKAAVRKQKDKPSKN